MVFVSNTSRIFFDINQYKTSARDKGIVPELLMSFRRIMSFNRSCIGHI